MVEPLRILLANSHPYLPEVRGGAQSSMDQLARSLRGRGHEVAVLAGLLADGAAGLVRRAKLKLASRDFIRERLNGYTVYRSWDPAAVAVPVAAEFRPDVVVPQSFKPVALAHAFARWGAPTVLYIRNVEDADLGGDPRGCADAVVANSRFTASHLMDRWGLQSTVILPMIEFDRYVTRSSREFVTFINPHPHKGRDIVLELARRMPDVRFLLTRAWTLPAEDEAVLVNAVASLPNVVLRTSTGDMRRIYGETRVLLAPSQWREAFGRVAAEAQVSGIPVLASDIGGLPEAVGDGGILLPPDAPVGRWSEELRQILDDRQHYQDLSDAALSHSRRPALDIEQQVDRFVEICRRVCDDRNHVAGATT